MASNGFSEVDMMVLAKLAYFTPAGARCDENGNTIISLSLEQMLKDNHEALNSEFGINYLNLLNKVKGGNYYVSKAENDINGSGFAAIAITGPTSDVVTVAARGTEGLRDVGTDIQLGFMTEADQQRKMNEFMAGLGQYKDIYLTGHSLGGNLAASGAVGFVPSGKIKEVYTYNAPGFNGTYRRENADKIKDVEGKITNYQNEGDIISDIMEPIGGVVVLKSKYPDTPSNAWQNHGLGAFYVDADGFLVLDGKGLFHKSVKVLSTMLTEHPHLSIAALASMNIVVLSASLLSIITLTLTVIVVLFVANAVGKVLAKFSGWIKDKLGGGSKYASANPLISIETDRLRVYASRLTSVNNRLASLDSSMNSLYLKVGLKGVWDLLKADYKIKKSSTISRSASWLLDTAKEFEGAESNIISQLG